MVSFKSASMVAAVAIILAALAYNSFGTGTRDTLDYGSPPPWPIFTAVSWLAKNLRMASDFLTPPAIRMIDSFVELNQRFAIYVCSEAGWPSLLQHGARTGAEMAAYANMSVGGARRVLRACMTGGLFRETTAAIQDIDDGKRMYVNTPLSDVLRDDHPFSVKAFIGHEIEDIFPALMRWSTVWSDESTLPFSSAHKVLNTPEGVWQYFRKLPEQASQFNKAMTSLDSMTVFPLVQDYPWAQTCSTVLDIGGGRGTLLATILSAAPALKGVLVDLPSVIDQSEPLWAKIYPGLLGRVSFVRGSFFDAATVPKNTGQGRHCYTSKVRLALRCRRC